MANTSKWVALGALVMANTALLTETIGYSHNSLAAHPDWVLGKHLLEGWVMGAEPTVFRRNLLHRNQLQLHAWFGYQKVYHAEPLPLGTLEVDFTAAERGYLVIEYARTKDRIWGVRLSRHPTFESVHFSTDAAGDFVDKAPLDVTLSGAEHAATLEVARGRVTLALDGRQVLDAAAPTNAEHTIAFRGGRQPVRIDAVRAGDTEDRTVLDVGFGFPWSLPLVLACLGLVAISAALPLLWTRLRRSAASDALLASSALQFMLAFAIGGYFAIDYYLWSANYFVRGISPDGLMYGGRRVRMEDERREFFARYAFPFLHPGEPDYRPVAERLGYGPTIDANHREMLHPVQIRRPGGEPELVALEEALAYIEAHPFDPGTRRVILIGGSQTAGSGARRLSDRIAFRLQEALDAKAPVPVALVNVARDGSVVVQQQKRYAKVSALGYDLAIVNVGNNDALEGFEGRLRALLTDLRATAKKTLLVLEPNSVDEAVPPDGAGGRDHLAKKHAIMRKVAADLGLEVFDLDATVNAPEVVDAGFLWWDFVHMTSLGQRRASEAIATAAAPLLTTTSTATSTEPR